MQHPSALSLFLLFACLSTAYGQFEDDPQGGKASLGTKGGSGAVTSSSRPNADEERKIETAYSELPKTYVLENCEGLLSAQQCVEQFNLENPDQVATAKPATPIGPNGTPTSRDGTTDVYDANAGGVPTTAVVNPQIIEAARVQEQDAVTSGDARRLADVANRYINGGSSRDADRVATQALRYDPNNSRLLSTRARARALSGDTEGAVADARRVVKLDPDDQVARIILGNRDQLAQASQKLRGPQFGELAPQEQGTYAAVTRAQPERAQYAAVGLPLAAAARAPMDAALLMTRRPMSREAAALFESARSKLALGDLSGAYIDATRSSDMAKEAAAPLVLRAHVSNRRGAAEAAVADATKALLLEPENAAALRERAYGKIQIALYEAALADLDQALRLEPQSGTAYYYRGMAHEKLGRVSEALADYERAAALDPGLGAALADARARLAPAAARAPIGPARQKWLLRAGLVAASLFFVVMGLAGSAAGRRLATTARAHLWESPSPIAPSLSTAVSLKPGALIGGNLRIVRELGRGGMGVVYEAFDETLQRRVAVKRLQRDANTTGEDFARFLMEARTVARLKHPRLAEIFTVLEDGDVFLVFEFVEGQSLDKVLARRMRLPLSEVRRAVVDIAAAVGYAHSQKVIHKDLKPANVVLEPAGGCKVMDFGIAHHSVANATVLTRTTASGTPPYMSPEQAMGSVSKSSDLYALAVMSYELLTGRRPFEGPDFLEQKLNRQFPLPSALDPSLPRGLDEFFRSALDPDPTKRPKSADDFISLLDRASVA